MQGIGNQRVIVNDDQNGERCGHGFSLYLCERKGHDEIMTHYNCNAAEYQLSQGCVKAGKYT